MDAKDEVKSRLSVEEVVAGYIELKRAGRNFKGLSPWSNEKTASLMVSPEKQIWHDFSSNRGGDIFSFVMEMEGIDFKEALEMLARKAGVELTEYQRGDGEAARLKKRLYEAHNLAVNYYQTTLVRNKAALDYVVKARGFTKDTVRTFQIGYAPVAGNALTQFLKKRGFSLNELRKAGLSTQYGKDMFRGRMVLALADSQGRVVGFTGRILKPDDNSPKYLNTPQTLVYDKGRQAYGMHLAKEAIRQKDFVIIVEGNTDVVSSHQAGVKNIVAAAGTALTNDHLKQLSRLTKNIRLAFDSDAAGLRATERAIGLAQGLDIELGIIEVPDGKDPDELVKKSPDKWLAAVEQSQYVMDWLLKHYQASYDLTSASGKREFTSRVVEVLSTISDPVEQDHYVEETANVTGVDKAAIVKKLQSHGKKKPKVYRKKVTPRSSVDKTAHEDTILAIALKYPDARDSLKRLEETNMSTDQRRAVLLWLQANNKESVETEIPTELQQMGDYVNILLLKAEELYGDWNSSDRLVESLGLVRRLQQSHKTKTKQHLSRAIAKAEADGEHATAKSLLEQYQTLLKG